MSSRKMEKKRKKKGGGVRLDNKKRIPNQLPKALDMWYPLENLST